MSTILSRVEHVARALGADVTPDAIDAMAAWIDLVAAWNKRMDLTAAKGDDELVDLMVADALVLASRLPQRARVVDVGTGAGAPGMPLALARPDLGVTLVEPLQKRVSFLRTAAGSVARGARLAVTRGKGEEVHARGERFDVAVSRATLAPPAWLALGAGLAPAGEVWVLLAREEPPTLAGWSLTEDARYRWPLTGRDRRAARFASSASATPTLPAAPMPPTADS
jgi:16S rRNA (guanine527-N7)-methyltransferase